jgi:hypothetical protein
MKDKISLCLIVAVPAGAMILGLLGKPTEMGIFVLAAGIGLAFANIDKIQRFKGAGFEAEMRKAVEEAYATTESLKAIAKPLILSNLSNLIYAGRWGGMNSDKKHTIKKEMDKLARSGGREWKKYPTGFSVIRFPLGFIVSRRDYPTVM